MTNHPHQAFLLVDSFQAASLTGVSRILVADHAAYAHGQGENLAALVSTQVSSAAGAYTHVLTASTSVGKSFLPRAAVIADSAPITDVVRDILRTTLSSHVFESFEPLLVAQD